jgi:hypothetical protein
MKLSLKEWLAHPATKAMGIVGVTGGVLHLPLVAALWTGFWGQLGTIFTLVSVGGFTIAPRVDFINEEIATAVALTVAALYGLKKLLGVYRGFRNSIDNTES